MKAALIIFALIGLGLSAPQPRKDFHDHFGEFIQIIRDEVGDEMDQLMNQYLEFDEFATSLEYISTKNFKDLIYEMESLPEFQAVVDFLENDNIDIHFFIDLFNEMLENFNLGKRSVSARLEPSGTDFRSYIQDCISLFPQEKLAALYDQKMAEDDEFKNAIDNLKSDEWDNVFTALWDSDQFQAEVQTLDEHGIDIHEVLHEIIAVFGQ